MGKISEGKCNKENIGGRLLQKTMMSSILKNTFK
jgi:hypothetical protein